MMFMVFMVIMVFMVTSVPAKEAVTLPLLLSKEERKPLGSSEITRPSQTLTQNQSQTKPNLPALHYGSDDGQLK